jgi:hypothetical protein
LRQKNSGAIKPDVKFSPDTNWNNELSPPVTGEHARENHIFGVLHRQKRRTEMDVIFPRCCGLDVHKKSITACVLIAENGRRTKHLKRFGTMTADLRMLGEWLTSYGTTDIAMESTGVYWKPVWNILAELFKLHLVNAQHIKNVPGRKTDMKDCEWIAQLPAWVITRQFCSKSNDTRTARS